MNLKLDKEKIVSGISVAGALIIAAVLQNQDINAGGIIAAIAGFFVIRFVINKYLIK